MMLYEIFYVLFLHQLKKEGFTNVDALDASQEMLNIARQKGIYNDLLCAYVEKGRSLPIEDSKYRIHNTYSKILSLLKFTQRIYLIPKLAMLVLGVNYGPLNSN